MLTELRVRDLGVIADLTLDLGPGMTALTGETGAGKTLLVQALQVVLGGRASSGIVRAGAAEAIVEARFSGVSIGEDLEASVETHPDGDAEALLARAVAATGRSRAWIDGRMTPVAALGEIGGRLVEILGQHEQQTLLATAAQRSLLDRYAGSDLGPLRAARAALAELQRQLGELGGDERDRARRADLLRYQVAEIEAARIGDPAEEDELAAEEERLADLGALRAAAAGALALLDGDGNGRGRGVDAGELIGSALGELANKSALQELSDRLRQLQGELADVSGELRTVVDTWEDDPQRLDEVQARRRLLADLRRKYGDTLADVVAFGEDARVELDRIERQSEIVAELERRRAEAAATVDSAEAALRRHRLAAAPGLSEAATGRLRALAMPDAELAVEVADGGAGDAVVLTLGANRGEPRQPLSKVASGGELARTMLALRLVVGGGAPTMLFDEVDAGVGGAAALALAQALAEIATGRQVLVVTHLAQVAAFADHQVVVRKSVVKGRTVATAELVSGEARVVELSRMLSGHPDSPTARAHADELLEAGRRSTRPSTRGRARRD